MKPERDEVTRVSDVLHADLDSQLLLAHLLGVDRAWLYAHGEEPLTAEQLRQFDEFQQRLSQGEPVAYIVGKREFWKSTLDVNPSVLIPRPETELLVEIALSLLKQESAVILDVGTGSGAIAVALKTERPGWNIIASDISESSLETAAGNTGTLNIALMQGNLVDSIATASVNAIVSNPPYVREGDPHLDALQHEPRGALVSGTDGLDAIRHLIIESTRVLAPGGWLILEHGYDQQAQVMELLLEAGFTTVTGRADMNSVPRAVYGQLSQG